MRRQLREVQLALRQDIDQLRTEIEIVDIAAIPILVGVVAIVLGLVRMSRRRRRAAGRLSGERDPCGNPVFMALFGVTIVAVIVAVAGVARRWQQSAARDPRINQPVMTGSDRSDSARSRASPSSRVTARRRCCAETALWVVEEKNDYPADAGKMKTTLFGLGGVALCRAENREARPLLAARRRGPGQKRQRCPAPHPERRQRQADGRDDLRQAALRYFRRRQ